MGCSIGVEGVRDLDGRFAEMMEVKQLCDKRDMSYPKEVQEYFKGYLGESDEYIKKGMEAIEIPKAAQREGSNDYQDFIEIELSKLPEELKVLRFYLSC